MPYDSIPDAKLTLALDLKAAHTLQIEALTAPGLTDQERVERFAEAAGFSDVERGSALARNDWLGPAKAVWYAAFATKNLFANLPSCLCPVNEKYTERANWPDIPPYIPDNWQPAAAALWPFSRVQIYARTGLEV